VGVTQDRPGSQGESPVRDALLERIAEREPAERGAALAAFAAAYLRRLSVDAADALDPDSLLFELEGAFTLADRRGGEPLAVRAWDPAAEGAGYQPGGSVLETNTPDLPFLVDSVTAELEARGLEVRRLQHPIIGVERGPDGRILRIAAPRDGLPRESVMHFELDRRLPPEELRDLEAGVRTVLAQVRQVVADFPAMRERVGRLQELAGNGAARYDREEVAETVAFLNWLQAANFIFLGYREYDFRDERIAVRPGSGLGLLVDESTSSFAEGVPFAALPPGVRERALEGDLLVVTKANALSPVHRRARLDYVGIRRVAPDGRVVGEARLLGLFTTRAYAEPASETPLLGRKLRWILDAEELIEGSHDYKAAVGLFESFPKDELFAAPVEYLRGVIVTLLGSAVGGARLLGRRAPDGRSASLVAVVGRGRFNEVLLERLREVVGRALGADSVDAQIVLDEEREQVRVHLTVHAAGGLGPLDLEVLEPRAAALTRTWDDLLRDLLVARAGRREGRALAQRWSPRFPDYYKASNHPRLAVSDVLHLDRLDRGGEELAVGLQDEGDVGTGLTRFALYTRGGKIELSRVMPILEHLGLRVVEEVPTRLLGGDGQGWVQDFGVLGPGGEPLDLDAVGDRIADCAAAVFRGEAESDSLHRLIVLTGLDWRRLTFLRAYRKYRQRIGSRFTEGYQTDALAAHPALTEKLLELFEARFDPRRERDPGAEAALREEIVAALDAVESLDHDRILRNQLGLIEATKRTNAYRPGRGAIAFKLRSAEVPAIPQPTPQWEIYAYAPHVEGIHLRGGSIARGGIRHSDRMDYRTEVLGLMRAQLTKNAIIVPSGAKGGFLLKAGTDVETAYVSYVRALLDVTDNLVDGEVIHPEGVRVLDEDDTYLVVAADKGTARMSDTANRVAREYGYWLDDAFASGGSTGYDHKVLGITARGAWESLKRHFRELGLDPEADPFTAVGIGDMSGDVFGNGMLLSDRIRLLAAYDHRHVFLDPDPDPERGFAERRRLFDLGGSSWADYDRAAISEGGGVWSRAAKSIPLSAPVRAALEVEAEALPPTEVVRAILRAPADVLWNGGIGTVVKASTESDADAQDRASDAVRVDARDVRARVVVEGGNLGLTRRARVEYAAGGGRVNADFIDNSAGVDCSDHEVNLKILLGLAERAGELARPDRDALLREMTEPVVAHVLYDSFLQAQIVSQEHLASAGRMFAYEDLMAGLEAGGRLDRAAEALPTTEEMTERRRAGRGMQRPELAILVAYAKRDLARALRASALPDDPWLERDLRGYFPAAAVERFGHHLEAHPLRRRLVAMVNANLVVNSLGPAFVSQLEAERGAEPAEVVRAHRIAREVTGAPERWDAIEALTEVAPEVQVRLMAGADRLVETVTRWYLAWGAGAGLAEATTQGREGFLALADALPHLGSPDWRERCAEAAAELARAGVPAALAEEHPRMRVLASAPDVVRVGRATGRPVRDVAEAFLLVGDGLGVDWLERELDALRPETRTQRWALSAVREDLARARAELAERALGSADGARPVAEALEALLAQRAREVGRLRAFGQALSREAEGTGDRFAALSLAVRHLRAVAEA